MSRKQLQGVKIFVGLLLLILAAFFPVQTLRDAMTDAFAQNVQLGPTILQVCITVSSVVLLAWAFTPARWFNSAGLPASATGLRTASEREVSKQQAASWSVLGGILLSGTVLRLIGLNSNLWIDEIGTVVHYMRSPVLKNLYTYGTANQHQLYSILGSFSIAIFGESEWAVRLPAVLLGIGSLAGLYFLARLITSDREAVLATVFMTVSYHHVWFSQNARGYTGMIFCTVWGTYFFARALAQNRTRDWAAYIATMVAGIFFLQNTAFVFAGHIMLYFLILLRWRERGAQHWPQTNRVLVTVFLVGLFTLTLHSLALPQIISWYVNEDRTGLGFSNIAELFNIVLVGLRSGFGLVGLAVGGILVGSGWLSYLRQSPLVTGLLTLPLVFNIAVLMIFQIGAYPRSFLYILPFVLLLVVRGGMVLGNWIAQHLVPAGRARILSERYLGFGLVSLMLVASTLSLLYNYAYPKQDFSGALNYVLEHRSVEDEVAVVGLAGAGFRDYYDNPVLNYTDTIADLQALQAQDHVVWVIYSFPRDMRLRFSDIYDYIEQGGELVATLRGTLEDGNMYIARLEGRA